MPLENQPMGILSAADRLLIEEEHTRLERMLNDLCDTCSNFATLTDCRHCSKEKIASCQGRLPSFFFDFQDFVAEHFENEESIMDRMIRPSDINEYLRKHQQEHATLMLSVKRLVQEVEPPL